MTEFQIIRDALNRARPTALAEVRLATRFAAKVAYETGISVAAMRGPSRKSDIVRARWAAMYAMRQAGHSFPSIGRFFNRDHTSVIHAIKAMEGRA